MEKAWSVKQCLGHTSGGVEERSKSGDDEKLTIDSILHIFISLAQPIGALLPIGEMQSRWFALLMANKLKLPTVQAMNKDIALKKKFMKRFYSSERHTIQVDWLPFMDELATK